MSEGQIQIAQLVLTVIIAVISPGGLFVVWSKLHARVKESEIKIQEQKAQADRQKAEAEQREIEHQLEIEQLRIQAQTRRDDTQGQNFRDMLQMFTSLQQAFQQQNQQQTAAIQQQTAAILQIDPALQANAKVVAEAVSDSLEIGKTRIETTKANTQAVEKQTTALEALVHANTEFSRQLTDVAAKNLEAYKAEVAPIVKQLSDVQQTLQALAAGFADLPKRGEFSEQFTKLQQQVGSMLSMLTLNEGKQPA